MMRVPANLMLAIGKFAMNRLGAGLVADVVEIAKAAWDDWKKSPEERLEEIEALVGADDEATDRVAEQVAAELAAGQPEAVRIKLATFLKQIPNRIRQSQRRPADPSGRSIRPGFVVSRPEDLISLIPDQLPRFQAGARPLAGVPWVLDELLGIGGFGEVWKARHAHLQSRAPVALKFCTDAQARSVLHHEAKVIDRLMLQAKQRGLHRGIVALQDANLDSEPPYLQYDYVQGGDLGGLIGDWHRRPEGISAARVSSAMLQLAEIVGFAHRLDPPIVHRDLKPANILVPRFDADEVEFKITDFGIGGIASSQAIQASRQVTSPSQFLATAVRGSGSYLYASPEQFEGRDPDPRDDVHALGVIWYQMMTGNLTRGPNASQGWRRRFLERGMSEALLELLGSCLDEEKYRPDNAAVLAEKLADLVEVDPKEIVNSIGMKLKLIPAGEFEMGSPESDSAASADEKPQHTVRITQPFYLGIHQVTRGQFGQFVEAARYQTDAEKDGKGGYGWNASSEKWERNPKFTWRSAGFEQTDDHPVVNVSWNDARAFCDWLSKKEGQEYRLPTEAEWEYACRAGTTTRFSFGDDEKLLGQYAWYRGNSNNQTHPVGEKKANAFGLHDMHGNVWEWCMDWCGVDYYKTSPASDPPGPGLGEGRVFRGGSWSLAAEDCRAAYRNWFSPSDANHDLGLRLARVPSRS